MSSFITKKLDIYPGIGLTGHFEDLSWIARPRRRLTERPGPPSRGSRFTAHVQQKLKVHIKTC